MHLNNLNAPVLNVLVFAWKKARLINVVENCDTFSDTLLQQSYDSVIEQTYEERDLQICIVVVAVKKSRSALYAQCILLCYTQNIQT